MPTTCENWLGLVNCCIYYAQQTHDIYQALPFSVHDDVIKWKHFPRYWPFVRGIHRSPVNSTHKGQWRGALMLPSICVWTNAWVNNRDAGDLRRYRVHYDGTVMWISMLTWSYEIHRVRQYLVNVVWFGIKDMRISEITIKLKSKLYFGTVNIFPNFWHCSLL